MGKSDKINEKDHSTLARALDLERRFDGAGIFPRGGPQTRHFDRLVRLGLLEDTGEYGRDLDAEVEQDVRIYKLTEKGRAWVTAREDAAEAALAGESS